MIEKELAVGYGIIISVDTVQEIREALNDEDYDDLFDSGYLRCIDSWSGDDYFLGAINYLGSIEEPLLIKEMPKITIQEAEDFVTFLFKQPWREKIAWEPETYLIEFIY